MEFIETTHEKHGDEDVINMNSNIISLFDTFRIKLYQSGYAECHSTWGAVEVLRTPATLYYITEGSATLHIEGKDIKMEPDNLYFIPPMLEFKGSCTHMKQLYFHLNVFMNDKQDSTDIFTGCRRIISLPVKNLKEYLKSYSGNNYSDFVNLHSLITQDLARIISEYDFDVNSNLSYKDSTTKALLYVKENLSGSLKVSDIAHDLYISKSKLTSDFFNDFGIHLSDYIRIELINEIQKLLIESNITTSEISDKLNFCSRSHFSAFFKKHCGSSPKEFRNQYRNQQ